MKGNSNNAAKYRVFLDEKLLHLSTKSELSNFDTDLLLIGKHIYNFHDLELEIAANGHKSMGLVTSLNPIDFFCKKLGLQYIAAGGGLVKNHENKLLVIYRRGKWDLPKGKLDDGEFIEDCALREVSEECGVKHLQIESFFQKTYHIYKLKNNYVLKETFWYKMFCGDNSELIPQKNEGIELCKWHSPKKLQRIFMENTYLQLEMLIRESKALE